MRLTTLLAPLAAGAVALGSASAATVTSGAVFTLTLGTSEVTLGATGDAVMTEEGAVFLPLGQSGGQSPGQADGFAPAEAVEGSYAGAGVTFSSGAVDVALTDFVIDDGEMTGLITATGVDGVGGLVMYGRMALCDLAGASDGFDLRLDGMAGGVLSDLLGVSLGGEIARLSPTPTPTPLPGALLFFATGAGALALRRRR